MDVMEVSPKVKRRPYCIMCSRPERTCICDLVVPCLRTVRLVVLQHPSEMQHPKGSVPLLQRCVANCEVVCGELFSPQRLLRGKTENNWLVYPDVVPVDDVARASPPGFVSGTAGVPEQLLLIDATWRKSRKIVHLNPWLLGLPRISLHGHARRYRIRKAQNPAHLSTFEAAILALTKLDNTVDAQPFMNAFEQFVCRYETFLPKGR